MHGRCGAETVLPVVDSFHFRAVWILSARRLSVVIVVFIVVVIVSVSGQARACALTVRLPMRKRKVVGTDTSGASQSAATDDDNPTEGSEQTRRSGRSRRCSPWREWVPTGTAEVRSSRVPVGAIGQRVRKGVYDKDTIKARVAAAEAWDKRYYANLGAQLKQQAEFCRGASQPANPTEASAEERRSVRFTFMRPQAKKKTEKAADAGASR